MINRPRGVAVSAQAAEADTLAAHGDEPVAKVGDGALHAVNPCHHEHVADI
jgi:hypothetical protein